MACQMQVDAIFRSSRSLCNFVSFSSSQGSTFSTGPPSVSFVSGFGLDHSQHRLAVSHVASLRFVCDSPTEEPRIIPKQQQYHDAAQQKVHESSKAHQNLLSPDRLVEQSVSDIISHIHEAPFLHMVFGGSEQSSCAATPGIMKRQPLSRNACLSSEEKWKEVKDFLNNASPCGVILVHHLDEEKLKCSCAGDNIDDLDDREAVDSGTNFWGLLVLGKSIARSACYILKTTSVASPCGGKCTSFCLTKAKCFGPSWLDQMQNCWLL